jgi:hypothetical protein
MSFIFGLIVGVALIVIGLKIIENSWRPPW